MTRATIRTHTQFSQPIRQIVWMLVVLCAVATGTWLIAPAVAPVFAANPWLNGTIATVFVIGVIACFAQVFQLFSSVSWIESFAEEQRVHDLTRPPGLLAPLATMLRAHTSRSQISTASSRSILDSVAQRMDEARDITRYIVNTLIFLGLLGTFWGLATTVPAVVDTIRNLNPSAGEASTDVFGRLIDGLEDQLAGMGTAFASSLLGLAGSLVVGLLELFAGHGQNRFYRELEDWLSTITRIGIVGDGETIDQYSLAAVLDHMNEQMETLQDMFQRSEAGRLASDSRLVTLSEELARHRTSGGDVAQALDALSNRMGAVMSRIADGQEALADHVASPGAGLDSESRMRLRSMDVQLLKLVEELRLARRAAPSQSIARAAGSASPLASDDLREDIGSLTRSIRQLNRLVAQAQDGTLPRGG